MDYPDDVSVYALGPIPSSDIRVCVPTIRPKHDISFFEDDTILYEARFECAGYASCPMPPTKRQKLLDYHNQPEGGRGRQDKMVGKLCSVHILVRLTSKNAKYVSRNSRRSCRLLQVVVTAKSFRYGQAKVLHFGTHPGVGGEELRVPPIVSEHMKRIKNQIGQRCQPFVRSTRQSSIVSLVSHY